MTKERMREYFSFLRSVKDLPHTGKTKQMLDDTKRFLRSETHLQPDPILRSLRDHFFDEIFRDYDPYAWRTHVVSDAWDSSWYRYTIVIDSGQLTDAQIDERIESLRMSTGSCFDCTGRPFTIYLHWKRTPAGIAIIHHIGIDV